MGTGTQGDHDLQTEPLLHPIDLGRETPLSLSAPLSL